ncbi:hypothetical protein HAX54_020306 [Datura stramonium]|uniref:Uncharacterized protein n=1 Tax=Datura stramonium TaxID=4076 RepID=A0ABS8UT19_DATST|nr:hypothetical protein [Datura stramonium]
MRLTCEVRGEKEKGVVSPVLWVAENGGFCRRLGREEASDAVVAGEGKNEEGVGLLGERRGGSATGEGGVKVWPELMEVMVVRGR